MLASITPLGQRGRGASWRRTVTAYVPASVVGGAVMGTVLGTVGRLAFPGHGGLRGAAIVVGVAALLAVATDVTGRVPGVHRQVDETWLVSYRDWVHGAAFGFQLGLGAMTIVTSASLYLTWLLELLTASPLSGAVVGAVFGLTRALPLLTTRHVVDAESLRTSQRRWQRLLNPVRRATTGVMASSAIAVLAVAVA